MKGLWKATAAAAAMAGAMVFGAGQAEARVDIGVSFNVPGAAGVDYDSGGYCDEAGCPDEYWGLPVYYGPVFAEGRWFNGPVYYRDYGGARWFWVRGGWHRDEWRGPHPSWWRSDYRYGPALGYDFYLGHGFHHGHDHYWRGDDWRPGRSWDHSWYEHHSSGHGDWHDDGHGDHHDHDAHGHDHGHDHDHDHDGDHHDHHDHDSGDHHDHDSGGDHHDHHDHHDSGSSGSGSGSGDDDHHHHHH